MSEMMEQRSRRGLLGAGLGALAAAVATSLGRPREARAANDNPVLLGRTDNVATDTTKISYSADTDTVFWADTSAGGIALEGSSSNTGVLGSSVPGTGVQGISSSGSGVIGSSSSSYGLFGSSSGNTAVYGDSNSGVSPAIIGYNRANAAGLLGYSTLGAVTLPSTKAKTGVYGEATQDSASRGVWGKSASGQAVRGEVTSGSALFGQATTGLALEAFGRVQLSTSGIATITSGTTSKVVTPGVDVSATSIVLLTPGADIGTRRLWYTKDISADTITVHLSSSRTSATKVSWVLLG
jgi:hypothetical protein